MEKLPKHILELADGIMDGTIKNYQDADDKGYKKESYDLARKEAGRRKNKRQVENKKSFINFDEMDGNRIIPNIANVEAMLSNLDISIRLNEITDEMEIKNPHVMKPQTLEDLSTYLVSEAQSASFNLKFTEASRYLKHIGKERSYNPMIDFLNDCIAFMDDVDPEEVFEELSFQLFECLNLDIYSGAQPNTFYFEMFKKWLLSGVVLWSNTLENQYEPHINLILSGPEGIGKTGFFKRLLPDYLSKPYAKADTRIDFRNKDSIMESTKFAMVEIGEIEETLKNATGDSKAFFTSSYLYYRKPYDKGAEKHPKRTLFMGTTNDTGEILSKETGSRRFCIIHLENINRDRLNEVLSSNPLGMTFHSALWGAAYQIFKKDESCHELIAYEMERLKHINDVTYQLQTPLEIAMETAFDWESHPDSWTYSLRGGEVLKVLQSINPQIRSPKGLAQAFEKYDIEKRTINGSARYEKLPRLTEWVPFSLRMGADQKKDDAGKIKAKN